MRRVFLPLIVVLLALVPVWMARATVVDVEIPVAAGLAAEDVRSKVFQAALEQLIKSDMQRMNLDVAAYEKAFETKFNRWFEVIEKRRREELAAAGTLGEAQLPIIDFEKEKSRSVFAARSGLVKKYTIKKFAAHPEKLETWQMTLEGDVDERLLSVHVQRMLQEGEKAFRRLWILTTVRPANFGWEDLKLTRQEEFTAPIEAEWLKWFQENIPDDVQDVALCDDACKKLLENWNAQDEKSMQSFLAPEFLGGLLLNVNITLDREVLGGTVNETRINYGGGVVLQDLNSKRVLHWADLPRETQTLRQSEPKLFNSAVASHCYRYTLGKFLEVKNQVGKSVSLPNSITIRLVHASHMGQALRLIDWIREKGAPMQAQGKLDSFNRKETRVLIFFRGEGNKFKSLVSGVKELESEWGPLTVDDTGADLVITLTPKS